MNILLIAPNVDAMDVGEAFVAHKWSEALSKLVNLTVLTFHRGGRPDPAVQLPHARVVTWPEPGWARKNERINAMLKPAWPVFSRHVRNWLSAAIGRGERFDIAHIGRDAKHAVGFHIARSKPRVVTEAVSVKRAEPCEERRTRHFIPERCGCF
jgi:hypothetical protein